MQEWTQGFIYAQHGRVPESSKSISIAGTLSERPLEITQNRKSLASRGAGHCRSTVGGSSFWLRSDLPPKFFSVTLPVDEPRRLLAVAAAGCENGACTPSAAADTEEEDSSRAWSAP